MAHSLQVCVCPPPPQLTGGDLMSNLMEMEQGKLFDSHKDTLGSMIREGARLISAATQKKQSTEGRRSSFFGNVFNKG